MAFQKGNKIWQQRQNPGKKRKFRTATALLNACIDYFEWIEANPLMEEQAFNYQGDVTTHDKPLMRAMTITGLCLHIGVTTKCWRQWRTKDNAKDDKTNDDWLTVVDYVEAVIWEQKFTGAAAGLLKENIISRELGLQERINQLHSGAVDVNMGLDDATQKYLEAMNGRSSD